MGFAVHRGGAGIVEGSVIKRKINILLLAIPLVLLSKPIFDLVHERLGMEVNEQAQPFIVFILAAATLVPLAGFVESAVEELAELLGPFLGGLLHTTFGNVAE